MPSLNVNIPRFNGLLRKDFLYDGQSHHGADFNGGGAGTISVQDIFDFLAAYFAGCS